MCSWHIIQEATMIDKTRIFAIERPHPKLMKLYILRSIMSGPFIVVSLPLLYFRYHTLRYRFDEEGIGMSWGILFRREVNLAYARIQDIHLTSGPVQRWLGLAEGHIQTASGSAAAEMTIEGVLEFEEVRDYLYTRMRGFRDSATAARADQPTAATPVAGEGELVALLEEIRGELRGTREAMERLAAEGRHE